MLQQEQEDKEFHSYKSVVQAKATLSTANLTLLHISSKKDYLEFEILYYNEIPL